MKKNWEVKKLGEIIKLEYGKPLPHSKRKTDGAYPVYGANGEIDRTDDYYHNKQSIIVGRKGSAGEINLTEKRFWPLDVTYFVTFEDKKYSLAFLYNLLLTLNLPKLAKGVKPGINRNEVYEIRVNIPSLLEQNRIVAILDEAFEKTATAKENTEKNLKNARELFVSYLQSVFANSPSAKATEDRPGDGWEEKKLGEVCVLRSGTTLPPAIEKTSGDLPYLKVADMNLEENQTYIVTSSRFVDKSDINGNGIIPIGSTIFPKRGGAIFTNKKRITSVSICMDLNLMAVTPKKEIASEFIFYYFLGLDLRKINSGSSIPQINNYNIEPLIISFPASLRDQRRIVAKLDALSAETKKLEAIYQQKLTDLDELKKTVLKKVFNEDL